MTGKVCNKNHLLSAVAAVLCLAVASACAVWFAATSAHAVSFRATDDIFVTSGDNLFNNAGFEETLLPPSTPATDIVENWCNVGWCDPFPSLKTEGNQSLKICYGWTSNGPSSNTYPGVYQDVAVEKNTDYLVTFKARLDNADKADLRVGFRDPESGNVWAPVTEYVVGQNELSTAWQTYQYAVNSGDRDTLRIFFYTQGQGTVSYRAFYIDETAMRKIDSVDENAEYTVGAKLSAAVGYVGGDSERVVITADYGYGYSVPLADYDGTVAYQTSATNVATVSTDGTVTPRGVGTAEITVTVAGEPFVLPFTVYEKSSDDLVIGTALPLITEGENLLKNPSFEETITGGSAEYLQTENWNYVMGGFDGNNDGGRGGSGCFKITYQWDNALNETNFPGFYQDVRVEKNTTYEYSFWLLKWSGFPCPDNEVRLGFRDPLAADVWEPVYEIAIKPQDITTAWTKYTVYFHTGEHEVVRVFGYANAQRGNQNGGYNIDDASLKKVTGKTDAVKAQGLALAASKTQIELHNDSANLSLRVVYPFNYYEQVTDLSNVTFTVADPAVLAVSAAGVVTGITDGQTQVTATVTVDGQPLVSNAVEFTARTDFTLEKIETLLDKTDIATGERLTLNVGVTTDKGDTVREDELDLTFTVSDPNVLIVYTVGDRIYVYGLSQGNATLTVKAAYFGKTIEKQLDFTVTGDLLVDGGVEFYEELSPSEIGWKIDTTCGAGVDESVDNIFARTGQGNFWCMAPCYWDENIPARGYVKIYQDVTLPAGEYTVSAYVNRFFATAADGVIDGFGGDVSIGFIELDDGYEMGSLQVSTFGTDVGANGYQQISHTAALTEGQYRIVISIVGDSTFGLGMQIDDVYLCETVKPKELQVTVGDGPLAVGDLAEIKVSVLMEDGSVLTDLSGVTMLSSNREVATVSSGYLVITSEGTTTLTVRCTVAGVDLEKTVTVTVGQNKRGCGCGSNVASFGAFGLLLLVPAAAVLLKRRKK